MSLFVANLAMSIAASANAPVLILAMYWGELTTRGGIAGIVVGLVSSLVLIMLGPQVMVDIMGMDKPLFPYAYPTIVSVPLAFLTIWYFSVSDKSASAAKERAGFADQLVTSETGIGIQAAVDH
ncbi:MAG: cation/acetate symporter [Paraglaciecola sp.]|jgi:cation/acetate symporter